MKSRTATHLLIIFALTAVYFAAAKLGLSMAFTAEQVTLVWPPTGIALAAILLFGYRVWPGIALGAFLANITAPHETFATASAIALGNTLEAVVGAGLLRWANFDRSLARLRDVVALLVLSAVVSTSIAATIGVTGLCLTGVQPWSKFARLWLEWWLGDAVGAILVAPAILTWAGRSEWAQLRARAGEAVALLALLIGAALIVFVGLLPPLTVDHPLEYVVFPFVIWAALRLGQSATTGVTIIASYIAIYGVIHGVGPFAGLPPHESLFLMQLFMAVMASTAQLLGAAITERNLAERRRATDYAIAQILAESANLSDAIGRIVRTIGESLEWEIGLFWRVDETAPVLRCAEVWRQPALRAPEFEAYSRKFAFERGIGMPGRVWASGAPAWIPDVTEDSNFPRASMAIHEGLRAAFAFPIRLGTEVLGVIEFFSREIREPDPSLLQMFAMVGSQIGAFIGRKRTDESLRESEARKTAILKTALDCVVTIDHRGKIIEFNPAAEKTFGYRRDEVVGREMSELLIPPALRERHTRGLAHYLATGEGPVLNRRIEITALRSDGAEFPVELAVTPISAGGAPMFTAHLRDITERKNMEEELLRRADQLAQADRRKDEFLAMLAHELRNPLAPIQNVVHIMRATGPDEQLFKMMERQVQQLVRLVDDLLEVARIERGQIELRKERVELESVIENTQEAIRPAVQAAGHRLTVKLPSEPLLLDADPVRMAQIFSNLLNNAIRYTDPGGNIELSAERQGQEVVVRVSDTGQGIAAEMLPRIFDKFVRADNANDRAKGGLGIGLALVRTLVTMHGGSVEAQSDGVGRGSVFTVRLPLALDQRPPEEPATRDVFKKASSLTLRILVVDDNRDVANSVAMILRLTGSDVDVVHDGPAALEAMRRSRPDVVFLDLGMPGMDGFEVARRVRAAPALRDIVLVALSGWGQAEDRRRCVQVGIDHHLLKPMKLESIEPVLASIAANKPIPDRAASENSKAVNGDRRLA